GEPRPEIHARRVARTTGNLQLAVRYLRAKLYSIGIVEALADVTGGDVPLDYFMGGLKATAQPAPGPAGPEPPRAEDRPRTGLRIEQFLPRLADAHDLDPSLHRLLAEGRASESSFDTGPSPLGAFLHATVGEAEVMKGVEAAKKWWSGGTDAAAFLASQPPRPVAAIARAAGHIIDTRREGLFALAERLER
ncbi:MAG TPA: hypothetical protein VN253_03100, partial [Kofleriaceae bacterium]|nr:hypothetical protein [Kofleriaceae bacterium]